MSATMAKPKKADGKGKKAGRTGVPVQAYIRPDLRAALETCIEKAKPYSTLTAHLELALEEYLTKKGFYAPADSQEKKKG